MTPFRQTSVLIVDDNPEICELFAAQMEREGFATTIATRPGRALLDIEKNRPDVVIVDVAMPEMDGFKFTRIVRAMERPPIVFIVTGGVLDDHSQDLAIAHGAQNIRQKPFDTAELRREIEALLDQNK